MLSGWCTSPQTCQMCVNRGPEVIRVVFIRALINMMASTVALHVRKMFPVTQSNRTRETLRVEAVPKTRLRRLELTLFAGVRPG